jgi:membrane-associated phospholipid phosphatase
MIDRGSNEDAPISEGPMSLLSTRRWFARYEGTIAPPLERALLVVLAYIVGGLGYLCVNQLSGRAPTFHRLGIPLDDMIPFVPTAVFVYVLVYVTPALAAVFLRDRAELYRAFLAFCLNDVVCFSIFLLYPVEFVRDHALPATIAGRILLVVQSMDLPVNCFPSHHVATAFTTFLTIRRRKPAWGRVFGVLAGLVAISTVLVKQHYVVDVPAGIAVALATAWFAFPPKAAAVREHEPVSPAEGSASG